MKKLFLLPLILLLLTSFQLFAGGMTEGSVYARTALDRKDTVSTYLQQVVEPYSLINGPLKITAVPYISKTYILSEYPDMKAKRYTQAQMENQLKPVMRKIDEQQEKSGRFLLFLRYERVKEMLGISSFTIDPSFFEYVFLDNDRGEFLRVGSHSIKKAQKVDISDPILEFWVQFGNDKNGVKSFFKDAKVISLTVNDFGFEGQKISFKLPLSKIYAGMPEAPKKIFDSLRSNLTLTFYGYTPVMKNIVYGTKIVESIPPTREGYTFEGWYEDSKYVKKYNFETSNIYKDMTLYAKWKAPYNVGDKGQTGGYVFIGLCRIRNNRVHIYEPL